MMAFLSQPVIQAIGTALLHFLWQGSLLAVLLAFALRLVKSEHRYFLACWGLFLMIVLPVITTVYYLEYNPVGASTTELFSKNPDAAMASVWKNASAGGERALEHFSSQRIKAWFFSFWLMGLFGLTIWHLLSWLKVTRTIRLATLENASWQKTVQRLSAVLGLKRIVRLKTSRIIGVPAVVGWLKPFILMPVNLLSGLGPQQLECILAHELAHVWRSDYLVNILQVLVETLLFFHPAVWWLSRRIRSEREKCCDELAASLCGSRKTYANALLYLEQLCHLEKHLVQSAIGGSLMQRIRHLIKTDSESSKNVPKSVMKRRTRTISSVSLAVASFLLFGLLASTITAFAASKSPAEFAFRGHWELDSDKGKKRLLLKDESGQTIPFLLRPNEQDTDSFGRVTLTRKSGSLQIDGSMFFFEPEIGLLSQEPGLTRQHLFGLAACDKNTSYVKALLDLGYASLSVGDIAKLGVMGVSPGHILRLRERGYSNLSVKNLLRLSALGVTPEYIRALEELGYRDLAINTLMELRWLDVTPEFIKTVSDLGFSKMPPKILCGWRAIETKPEEIEMLIKAGVTTEFVVSALAQGHRDLSPKNLLVLYKRSKNPGNEPKPQ